MWKDIFIDNKEACLKDLNEFKKQIEKFESIVLNEEDLEKYLQYASTLRSNWNE
jgi:prephenate dehydrogenase